MDQPKWKVAISSSIIMKKWIFEGGVLYCGDCIEVMKQMESQSVDLVFGSPPYEQARLYLEGGEDLGIARKTEDWIKWMVEVYKESIRVCKGLVAYVVGHGKGARSWSASPALLCAELIKSGINLRSPLWYKRQGIMGSGTTDWLRADLEWIICVAPEGKLLWSDNTACGHKPKYGPGGPLSYRTKDGTRVNQLAKEKGITKVEASKRLGHTAESTKRRADGSMRRKIETVPDIANPGNVIDCGVIGGHKMGSNISHENEAPFPDKLPNFMIRSFCPPGGIVLDPFSGFGTGIGQAIILKRKFIGIDLRMSQIELTKRRIDQVILKKGFGFSI